MSRFFLRAISFTTLITLFFIMGCGEDDPAATTIPQLTTLAATDITTSSAETGGTLISDGGEEIVIRGVCWSTTPDPTVADYKTTNGAGSDDFISTLTELTSNTTYYVRAYASNANGTGYGNSVSFTTGEVSLATVTTINVNKISIFTAESGGTITSDGNGQISARGVCWSTHENSTIADNKTTDGSGTGTFLSQAAGMTPTTTYYMRAYATNEAGTAYGDEIEFTTHDTYSGIYEVMSGTVLRELPDGSPDPNQSGDYAAGLTMDMVGGFYGQDTVWFFPRFKNGPVTGVDAIAIVDRSITSPDGSHPVKIMSFSNETLQNIPGTESKFFPGTPGTPGAPEMQMFVLNFEWLIAPGIAIHRRVTNLRLRFKVEFNAEE